MNKTEQVKTIKDYKSTPSRVIHSIGVSNLRLKRKNDSRKSEIQRLSVRTRDLEASRNNWKAQAKKLEQDLKKAEARLAILEDEKKSRLKLSKHV
jgi:hypothetical protein